jgi:hypothetical protein
VRANESNQGPIFTFAWPAKINKKALGESEQVFPGALLHLLKPHANRIFPVVFRLAMGCESVLVAVLLIEQKQIGIVFRVVWDEIDAAGLLPGICGQQAGCIYNFFAIFRAEF